MFSATLAWVCLPGSLTWLKAFKCLRLFKSMLLGGYMLNGTMIPIPGLKLLRPVCKDFAGQALLTDMTTYALHSCLILYIRGYVTLSFNSYCSFKTITYLRSHSLSFEKVNSSINAYRFSYFVNIPFLWNSLPASIVTLPTASQFRQSIHSYIFTWLIFILTWFFVVIWYNS